MHKLVVLYPNPDDQRAFLDYYTRVHIPLASQLPGLIKQYYGRTNMLGGGESYFFLWEGIFVSEEAMMTALKSEIGQRVAADVPNYSPKGATMLHSGGVA